MYIVEVTYQYYSNNTMIVSTPMNQWSLKTARIVPKQYVLNQVNSFLI